MARPSKFTDEQIKQALRHVQSGTPAAEMCRTLGVTQTTFYRWRKRLGGAAASGRREVQDLRSENQKLKQIVANFLLDKM
jgi:putative transposase